MAAAVEVAPRIVRPAPRITRPVREVPRPDPRITRPARQAAPAPARRGARAVDFVRGLPDHSVTDRLVRGRAWIPVLGLLLAGIVAIQVSLLQLNGSMGRAIEQGTSLQTKNGELRAEVAELSAVPRIERIAQTMGMVMTTPEQLSFLSPRAPGIRAKAIADMTAPSPSALAAVQAASSGTAPSTATTTASTSAVSTSTANAPGTGGDLATQTATDPAGEAPSTPAAGTDATTQSAQPADAGGDSTGAAVTPTAPTAPAGATGTGVVGQPSSGGASSTGTGG
jgi:cell division protein FtsL